METIFQLNIQKIFLIGIDKDLENVESKIYSNKYNKDELEKEVEKIEDNWKEGYKYLACFIEHDELEKVQTQIISMKANIKMENMEKSIEDAEICKFILKHIEQKDSLKIINIF